MLIKEEKILVDITSIKIIHSNIFDIFLMIGFYIVVTLLTILFIYWSINTVIFICHLFNMKKKKKKQSPKKKNKSLKQNKTRTARTKSLKQSKTRTARTRRKRLH